MTRPRRWPALQAIAALLIVGACGPTAGAGGSPPSAPPGGAVLTAEAIAFDRSKLAVPAGAAFPLFFENRESAPHNVTILDATDRTLFVGEIFGGPASRTYDVGPLPAGTYRFRCDVHPEMSGTLVSE
jgi:plastocyanin